MKFCIKGYTANEEIIMITKTLRALPLLSLAFLLSTPAVIQGKDKSDTSLPLASCTSISAGGYYFLENDLVAAGTCLVIEADFVTIDLGGYSLIGSSSGIGISDESIPRTGTTIINGTITGFADAIILGASEGTVLRNVRVVDNPGFGMRLGPMSTVLSSQAIRNGYGIVAECPSSISGNSAWDNESGDFEYINPDLCQFDAQNNSVGFTAAPCPEPVMNCDGEWVCLDSDDDNCGACGNQCASNQICDAGACATIPSCVLGGGGPETCDDANACTADVCDTIFGCTHTVDYGAPCSDNDLCTISDSCATGSCTGVPINRDDALDCTLDSCQPSNGLCTNTLDSNSCLIEGVCYGAGGANPDNSSESCQPTANQLGWTGTS